MHENLESIINNIINLLNIEKLKENDFEGFKPVYPFNTEDIASVLCVFEPYIINQDILTVTGSGDVILDLLLKGANKITCFDINKTSSHFALLKLAAIKAKISLEDYSNYFLAKGKIDEVYCFDIYLKFCDFLPSEERYIWDKVYDFINKNNIKITGLNTTFAFQQFDNFFGFPCRNWTLHNPNGYLTEDNYSKLLKIVETKSLEDIKFIDSALFDLPKKLQNNKYTFIYLSNIMDFTSTFIKEKSLNKRLNIFSEFIKNEVKSWTIQDGIVIASFYSDFRTNTHNNIYYNFKDCLKIFNQDDNYYLLDLLPYNHKDKIITFCNKKLGKQLLIKHDEFDFY